MRKCDYCINSRVIISENGYHSICCLSDKKSIKCLLSNYSEFINKFPTEGLSCAEGSKYYDIDSNTFYKYKNGEWVIS